jgi:hypothetical protein
MMSLIDRIKIWYYKRIGKFQKPKRCLCGGIITTGTVIFEGYEIRCNSCRFLYGED